MTKKTAKKQAVTKATTKAATKKTSHAVSDTAILEVKKALLTKEGLKKIQDELSYLKTKKREEISVKLKEAIAYGDLSENAEYDEAKNEQAFVESRIRELEDIIGNAEIIVTSHATSVVELGCVVTVQNLTMNIEEKYKIVGSTEADPLNGKISNESPVGEALLGEEVATVLKIKIPKGIVEYKILKIE